MRLRFTPSAKDQFIAAVSSIRRDDPGAAVKFRKKAETHLQKLEKYPASGRKLPEFPDLRYREIIVPPYRFFYRTEGQTLWVVAVWHGAQLPKAPSGDSGT